METQITKLIHTHFTKNMAGQNNNNPQQHYNATSKPSKPFLSTFPSPLKKSNLYSLALLLFLCTFAYLFGLRQHAGEDVARAFSAATSTSNTILTIPCNNPTTTTTKGPTNHLNNKQLDFSSHHVEEGGAATLETQKRAFPPCNVNFSEYTPCEDDRRSLKYSRRQLIYRERHCPVKDELVRCRIPAPYGYRNPFKWPTSRDYAWYANVPHKHLTVEKAVQNWIQYKGDRFKFPGGGTGFPNGANAYINEMGKLINLRDGSIRTAIDTGCGVASWGAYLLSRNVLTMSFAPRDTYEAQVQFALERGVPAMIGVMASIRTPYPSRAFDMAHCSRCLVPWTDLGGMYLMEVDRVLRPGGYWILSGPPIRWKKYWKGWDRTEEDLNDEQTKIENLAKSLCWKKLVERNDIAIWQKPINHFYCKPNRKIAQNPSLCSSDQDPDKAWYTKMETCLTQLPYVSDGEEVAGGKLARWPARLTSIPPRISSDSVRGVTSEVFRKDMEMWKRRISFYKTVNNQLGQAGRYRNLLDMNAFLGGFAAALVDDPVWVMNVVPNRAKVNTLGVIYERGLIGTYQDWCEAMSTYPRTYDLIHAEALFGLYDGRCHSEDILLEMDRILRPEGSVIIRDDVDILVKTKKITDGLNWDSQIVDHEDGPLVREKLLFAVKSYWTAPAASSTGQHGSLS